MPSMLMMRLIGAGVAVLLFLGLVAERSRWMKRAHADEAQLTEICTVTRTAANRPKLDCKQVAQQITFIGDALGAVKAQRDKAIAEDKAHAAEVESKQNIAGQETIHDYQKQIADVRARYAELLRRGGASSDHSSRGGATHLPSVTTTPSGTGQASGQNGLPPEDALIATEQALQLQAIQDYLRKVGIIR